MQGAAADTYVQKSEKRNKCICIFYVDRVCRTCRHLRLERYVGHWSHRRGTSIMSPVLVQQWDRRLSSRIVPFSHGSEGYVTPTTAFLALNANHKLSVFGDVSHLL